MIIYFASLFSSLLLPLMASGPVTPGQNHSLMTGALLATTKRTSEFGQKTQPLISSVSMSTRKPGALSTTPHTTVSGGYFTPANLNDESMADEEMIKTSSAPFVSSTQGNHSVSTVSNLTADVQTEAARGSSILSQSNTSTEGKESMMSVPFTATPPATTAFTSKTNNSTTQSTSVPLMPSTTSKMQGKTSTSMSTKHFTSPSLSSTPPTRHISTIKMLTESVENKSANTGSVTGGGTTQYTSLHKTSTAPTKTSSIPTTKRQKTPIKPGNKAPSSNGTIHGKAVAWIIGGALVLMMVAFLIIYVKKRKLQKQQMTTSDWAGPSPFLEGGAGSNGQVELRSSNRISLASFLPQRLSRRLSLLQETDEESVDIKVNTTFGREEAGDDVQANNGTTVVVPEDKSMGDAPAIVETSLTSSQTTDPLSMNGHSTSAPPDVANLRHDHSANPPTLSDAADTNPPTMLDDDLRQP